MRVHLKGTNTATYRLANGELKTAHYAWRGGPRLVGEPGMPEFVASYNAAVAGRVRQKAGTLQSIINGFENSAEFHRLADKTKKDYRRYIEKIEKRFSALPLCGLKDRRSRGVFKAWRDDVARESARSADYGWTVLARILSWAYDRGLTEANPCERGGRLYSGSRAECIWTEDDETKLLAVAPRTIRLAFMLAMWTGQRQADILTLPWSVYDGATIKVRQRKGKARIAIPVSEALKAELEEAAKNKTGPLIATNTFGLPWTSDGFRTSWGKTLAKAGIKGLTFHDIRGTAVTRLALAGATVPEIASVTGHSLRDVQSILDAHYLHRDPELAKTAIKKLEAKRLGTEFSK
jgi:integrase